MPRHKLCRLNDIEDPGSRGFSIETALGALELFVIKRNGAVFGYQNTCPHTGVCLDWMPHRFLDIDKTLIICATHGALFEIDNGHCVSGPCLGEKLTSLRLEVADNVVFLANPDATSGV